MANFKMTALAAGLALSSTAAFALPSFEPGRNTIEYKNYETLYRSAAACQFGGCLAPSAGDPTGYFRVDPSIAGNVAVGDVFVGVLDVQRITYEGGGSISYGTGDQEFSGYFAQEVAAITDLDGAGLSLNFQLTLSAAATDPFGILAAGEMFAFYVDPTYDFNFVAATPQDSINTVLNGTLWATLGVTNGYAYTLTDFATTINGSNTEAFLGMDVLVQGPAYNVELKKVNDENEGLVGGTTPTFLCSAADLANPAVICNDIVATSEIENNPNWEGGSGVQNSPWVFRSNDPADIYTVAEPGTLAMLGLGLLGLAGMKRRRAA